MAIAEELKKYKAVLTESTNSEVEDKISNFEKEIKKTESDYLNPKTAFRKNSPLGKFKKKPVKEDRDTQPEEGWDFDSDKVEEPNQTDDYNDYNAGWNDALDAISDHYYDYNPAVAAYAAGLKK